MKKLVSIVLALAMILMVGAAFAGTITVTNVKEGETYSAYRILNYRHNGDAWNYYLTTAEYDSGLGAVLEGVGFHFTATADGTEYYVDNTASLTDGAALAAALKGADLSNALDKVENVVADSDGQAVFSNLAEGYWFVKTSLGSLASLASYDAESLVVEKNSIPGVDKKESKTEGNYVDGPIDENIGDTVYYQVVVTDGTGTNTAITLTDTLSDGLDYKAGTIAINGTAVDDDADDTNWSVSVVGRVITIVLKAAYVSTLDTGDEVTLTYQATINEDAVIRGNNENKIELDYSAQHLEDKVYVKTYDIELKKQDPDGNALTGAEFQIYTTETGTTPLTFKSDATGYYLATGDGSSATISAGDGTGVNIRGLEPGSYWFEETKAPNGYNKMSGRQEAVVVTNATNALEVIVENQSGTVLPSTGGIGTTIFYILGGLLVVGAAVILVARRKASN